MKKLSFIFYILFVSCNPVEEIKPPIKYGNIVTKYTEIKEIVSKEVNDTFYIYIRLPKNYVKSNKRYPVLYLLDGDISFNMATSILRYLQYGNHVPDIIIAAPAYGTMLNDLEANYRERDYTISKIEKFEESGGANNYIKFIKNELIPMIDTEYRSNNVRIINGYSLGGLLAINILLTESELFDHYISGSPYLTNDIEILLEKADKLSSFDTNKRIFISVGKLEDTNEYHKPAEMLFNSLKDKRSIEINYMQFKGGTHFTCPSEALTYRLKYVFKND